MPAAIALRLFSNMNQLLDETKTQPISGDLIKRCLKFSEHLVATFKQYPDVLVAQPLLYKSNARFIQNLTFSTCIYTVLLCNRNKVNDVTCQQMLCAVLSLYGERQQALSDFYEKGERTFHIMRNKRLIEILNETRQDVWLRGYQLFDKLYMTRYASADWPLHFSKVQRLLLLSHYLAVHLTPNKQFKLASFASVIKQLVQLCPSQWLADIENLLEYPTLLPPGTLIRTETDQPALVLSVSQQKVLANGLNQDAQSKPLFIRIYPAKIKKILSPQQVSGFNQISKWWNSQWLEQYQEKNEFTHPVANSFKLDRPPAVLLAVQEHLNSGDVDIDKLSVQISEEPAFAQYLKDTATFSNRHKLPVQQVKHGLMMHGYERTNSMLIEQALLLRLNQSYFPLQQDFIQFTRLRACIAGILAESAKGITSENASTLACFASSGLFTNNTLKGRRHWKRLESNQQDIKSLFVTSSAASLHQHAITLAQAWQQPKTYLDALQYHFLMPQNMSTKTEVKLLATILGLSLILARQGYFSESFACEESLLYFNQSLAVLSLDRLACQHIVQTALMQSHSYCALI